MRLFKYTFTLFIYLQTLLTIAAPRLHPEAARLYDAGVRALTHGEEEKARTALEKAVELDASIADTHCVLRMIYKGAEEIYAAAEAFQRATIADENYIEVYYELGDVLLIHLGNTTQAIQVLQKAAAIDTDHARTRTLLGIAYFRDNLTDTAIRELRHAIKLDPTLKTVHYTLGTAFLLKPSESRFYLNLSKAYELAGAHTEAEKTIKNMSVLHQSRNKRTTDISMCLSVRKILNPISHNCGILTLCIG